MQISEIALVVGFTLFQRCVTTSSFLITRPHSVKSCRRLYETCKDLEQSVCKLSLSLFGQPKDRRCLRPSIRLYGFARAFEDGIIKDRLSRDVAHIKVTKNTSTPKQFYIQRELSITERICFHFFFSLSRVNSKEIKLLSFSVVYSVSHPFDDTIIPDHIFPVKVYTFTFNNINKVTW